MPASSSERAMWRRQLLACALAWLRAPVPHGTTGDHTDAPDIIRTLSGHYPDIISVHTHHGHGFEAMLAVRACDLIASCIGKAPP